MEKPQLLITGITGYIGGWVTKYAVESGKYRVRGTVRNPNDPNKKKFLVDSFGELLSEIEVVGADLLDPESIKAAIQGK